MHAQKQEYKKADITYLEGLKASAVKKANYFLGRIRSYDMKIKNIKKEIGFLGRKRWNAEAKTKPQAGGAKMKFELEELKTEFKPLKVGMVIETEEELVSIQEMCRRDCKIPSVVVESETDANYQVIQNFLQGLYSKIRG